MCFKPRNSNDCAQYYTLASYLYVNVSAHTLSALPYRPLVALVLACCTCAHIAAGAVDDPPVLLRLTDVAVETSIQVLDEEGGVLQSIDGISMAF